MNLHKQHCEAKTKPQLLEVDQLEKYLKEIPQWEIQTDNKIISRSFKFKDYHQTLHFINAVATIIHQENHHPDIKFGYNTCIISFSTHSAGGITMFDFICAAHIDQLMLQQEYNV